MAFLPCKRKREKHVKYIVYCDKQICYKEGIIDTIKRILKNVTYADKKNLQLKMNKSDNKCVVFIKNRDSENNYYQFKAVINV